MSVVNLKIPVFLYLVEIGGSYCDGNLLRDIGTISLKKKKN